MTKLTILDKRIIDLLKLHDPGLSSKKIYLTLKENKTSIERRLHYMKKHHILKNIRTYRCSLYKIDIRTKQNYIFMKIKCPKCGAILEAHDYQRFATCPDQACKTTSGNRTRFIITKKQIVSVKHILRERS